MKQDNRKWHQHWLSRLGVFTRWFIPGLGVKRWFLLILIGTTLIGVGLGVLILEIYRTAPETWWLPFLSAASLRFLSRPLRAIIFGGIGIGLITWGIYELNRSILTPFVRPGSRVVDTLRAHRQKERGPRVVAVGGGHGQATLLRGLKQFTHNLTAIVTVADDGGSSGRLRRQMGILPPGDIRNCLAALSNDEALLGQLFQYRFPDSDVGLNGHSFGNLFISALAELTGSFEEAVAESGRVLAVQGQVLPSTLHNVKLIADVRLRYLEHEYRVEGESQIPGSPGVIQRVWLDPGNAPAFPQAIQAILAADLVVIGPGSLYTSILPNLLVPDLADAIRSSRAFRVYVCNVATQPGETDGYGVREHLLALEEHIGGGLFDVALCNTYFEANLPSGIDWVRIDDDLDQDFHIARANLVDLLNPWRHDSHKLAQAVKELYEERTGPLVQ